MTSPTPASYDPRRPMCDQGLHARCADADRQCACACHRTACGEREVPLADDR